MVEADQLQSLKDQACRQGISLNRLVLKLLSGDTSASCHTHADLDALAATWSKQDEQDFNQAVAPLEQVDPALWS